MTRTNAHRDSCLFCSLSQSSERRIIAENEHGFSVEDKFPVSPFHCLIISKHHISSFFDITKPEQLGLLKLLDETKDYVLNAFSNEEGAASPTSFNIGINDGESAGQTVPHLHIHLIPRFPGDTPDPRGGVRWVLPNAAKYWDN